MPGWPKPRCETDHGLDLGRWLNLLEARLERNFRLSVGLFLTAVFLVVAIPLCIREEMDATRMSARAEVDFVKVERESPAFYEIRYDYTVGGRRYDGAWHARAARYRGESPTKVCYDPDKPEDSTLSFSMHPCNGSAVR